MQSQQETRQAACSCAPRSFTVQVDLSNDCDDDTLQFNAGIAETSCTPWTNVDQDDDPAADATPTKITYIRFTELGFDREPISDVHQYFRWREALQTGDTFTFESISRFLTKDASIDDQLKHIPVEAGLLMIGENANGEELTAQFKWIYSAKCGASDGITLELGDKLGANEWKSITYSSEFCPAADNRPSTSSSLTSPTQTPTMVGKDTSDGDNLSSSLPNSIQCPPAYNTSLSGTYVAGSEVEVNGVMYRCNPYPYAILCQLSSYRPQSTDDTRWNETWEAVSPCQKNEMILIDASSSTWCGQTTPCGPGTDSWTGSSANPSKVPLSKAAKMFKPSNPAHSMPDEIDESLNSTRGSIWCGPTTPCGSDTDPATGHAGPGAKSAKSKAGKVLPDVTLSLVSTMETPTMAPGTSFGPTVDVLGVMVHLHASIPLELANVSSTLSDDGIAVFESSCTSFVGSQLIGVEPHMFEFSCKIALQHQLVDPTSLQLRLEIKAVANETDAPVTDGFEYLLDQMFRDHNEQLADGLRHEAGEAGLDDFDEMTHLIFQVQETVDAPLTDVEEPDSKLVLWASIGIAAVGILIALLFLHRSKRSSELQWVEAVLDDMEDESSDSSRDKYALAEEGVQRAKSSKSGAKEVHDDKKSTESMDELREQFMPAVPLAIYAPNLVNTEEGNLEEEMEKIVPETPRQTSAEAPKIQPLPPPSDAGKTRSRSTRSNERATHSQVAASPTSTTCIPEQPNRQGIVKGPVRSKRHVNAPPGKLGIIIKQGLQGCMIHSVKPGSPMAGLLFAEDLILSLDDQDVTGYSASQLTILLAKNIDHSKKFTVLSLKHGAMPFRVRGSVMHR